MDIDAFLKVARKAILDGIKIHKDRIEFNGARAELKKNCPEDIAVAESIFSTEGHYTNKFVAEVKLLFSGSKFNREPEFNPIIFYIPYVRIIFVINAKEQISTRIFEEDLIKEIAIRETIERYIDTPINELDTARKKIQFRW